MIDKNILDKYKKIQLLNNLLLIKISNFYLEKVKEEIKCLGHFEGPLTRIVYPNEEKINLEVGNEFIDWVDDRKNMPKGLEGVLIHKYENRILLLTTQTCFSNCQYCFRQDILSTKDINKITNDNLKKICDYINHKGLIKEVILSGGDPMVLNSNELEYIIGTIYNETKIKNFRIHTRSIIYSPNSITKSKIKILKKYNVRLVFHISHPYEICDVVSNKIMELNKFGIKLYNQFPLLRGINDDYKLLIKHLEILDGFNIKNLSIFLPDPVKYSASYRISINRIKNIIKNFNWHSSGWINSTRFLFDSNIGKVRIEDIVNIDGENIIFKREGKEIIYYDFPEKLDIKGNIKTMLWKDYN